jgi:TolB protein
MNADGSGERRLTRGGAAPAWSPDGRQIAFLRPGAFYPGGGLPGPGRLYRSWQLSLANADGSGERRLAGIAGIAALDGDLAWSPDGRTIAFVSSRDGNREIYTVNSDGTGQRRLTRDPGGDRAPA